MCRIKKHYTFAPVGRGPPIPVGGGCPTSLSVGISMSAVFRTLATRSGWHIMMRFCGGVKSKPGSKVFMTRPKTHQRGPNVLETTLKGLKIKAKDTPTWLQCVNHSTLPTCARPLTTLNSHPETRWQPRVGQLSFNRSKRPPVLLQQPRKYGFPHALHNERPATRVRTPSLISTHGLC